MLNMYTQQKNNASHNNQARDPHNDTSINYNTPIQFH